MQSLKSRIFIWLIRNRNIFKLKFKPEVIDDSFSVQEFRDGIDRSSARIKLPANIKAEKFSINNINAEWIIPEEARQGKMLLYIHGGGFMSGSCLTHRMHVAKFANECKLKSLVFDYRLAPEHPFPAGIEDCVEVYSWLLENGYKAEDIILGGESAGGTLVLSLLLALKGKGINLPKASFSISPVTDLRCLAESFKYNAKNDIAPLNSWNVWTKYYIADHDPKDPLLSPQFGNFEGVTPLYICVGTYEIHLDDCINIYELAKKHGVEVTLKKWEKMVHAFPMLSPLFPEAKQAMSEICEFVKQKLN